MRDKTMAIILLVIMYLSTAGTYLGNEIAFEQATLYGLIDMAICSFVLMIVPLCFRIKNKELLSYKRGKKICSYNSWIIFGISMLMMIIFDGFGVVGGVGALFYYFINMSFFAYPKDYKKEEITSLKSKQEDEKVEEKQENKLKEDLYKQTINEEIKEQEKREKQETIEEKAINKKRESKKTIILYSTIGALSVILIAVSIYAFTIPSDYETEIKDLKNQISAKSRKITTLENEKAGLNASMLLYETYEEKADFLDEVIVFVIDGYGNYYYTYDQMRQVTQGTSFTFWAYNIEQAKSKGYRAWK